MSLLFSFGNIIVNNIELDNIIAVKIIVLIVNFI